jgi:hypothetical protein
MRTIVAAAMLSLMMASSCSKGSGTGSKTGQPDTLPKVTIKLPRSVAKTNAQRVFVHYMPWFEDPTTSPDHKWGSHWTMANRRPDIVSADGRRDIASYFYPLIGPYASSDSDVLDYHLLLMKYAGIDGMIADWYGVQNVYDYPLIKRNTDSLFHRTAPAGLGFAICYEDHTLIADRDVGGVQPLTAAQQDIAYVTNTYMSSSRYMRVGGKPLLLCFGPQVLQTGSDWVKVFGTGGDPPSFHTLWYASDPIGVAAAGEFAWVGKEGVSGSGDFLKTRAGTLAHAIAGAYPGFKYFYAAGGWGNSLFVIDHNGTSTLQATLDLARSSVTTDLQLITWNDFGEGTMIEPTREFGFSFLEAIQQYAGVTYTRSELELILRWYTLRKKYKADAVLQRKLTQAYYDLVDLDIVGARSILDAIP